MTTPKTYSNQIRHAEIHNARLARKAAQPKRTTQDEVIEFEANTPKTSTQDEVIEFNV